MNISGNKDTSPRREKIAELYAQYADMIYRLAFVRTRSASDSDDIVQEVFLRCIRSDSIFDDAEHQKAWFIRATINCTNSLLSSAWRRKVSAADEARLEKVCSSSEVYGAVLELEEKYRTVIHLYYYCGYSVSEIAKMLGRRENTVKSQLMRARDMLRTTLREVDFDV